MIETAERPPGKNALWTFAAIAGIAVLSIVLDALFRRTGREQIAMRACAERAA